MPLAKTAFTVDQSPSVDETAPIIERVPPRLPNVIAGSDRATPLRSVSTIKSQPALTGSNFQPRSPVITGEAHFKGKQSVDGIISGQLTANGGSFNVKQRPR